MEDRRKVELKPGPQFHPMFHWDFWGCVQDDGPCEGLKNAPEHAGSGGDHRVAVTDLSGQAGLTSIQVVSRDLPGAELPEPVVPVAFRQRWAQTEGSRLCRSTLTGSGLQTRPLAA